MFKVRRDVKKTAGVYAADAFKHRYGVSLIIALTLMVPRYALAEPAAPSFDAKPLERKLDALRDNDSDSSRDVLQRLRNTRPPRTVAASGPIMTLRRIELRGVTALPQQDVLARANPYLGRPISAADLTALTDDMTKAYREAGYFLSRVIALPQNSRNGVLVLTAVEGVIDEIAVTGDDGRYGARALLEPIRSEQPATLRTVERSLLALNERPGVKVRDTMLDEIGTTTGRFRLTVALETWRVHVAHGLDNSGSDAVGPYQAYSALAVNSAVIAGDSLGALVSTTPNAPNQLAFGRVSYDAPIGLDSLKFGGTLAYSDVYPNDYRRQLNGRTTTNTQEVRVSYAPLQSRAASLTFTTAFANTDSLSRNDAGTIYDDHTRTLGLSVDLRSIDSFGGWTQATLGVRQGLSIFGANASVSPVASRNGASGDFTAFTGSVARIQRFDDAFSVRVSANGQLATRPLLAGQQFLLGSALYGAGYFSGDNGFAGGAELRYDYQLDYPLLKGYQLYAFVEGGGVWSALVPDLLTLYSVGIGTRLYLNDSTQLGLSLALPVRVGNVAAGDPRDYRILFSLTNALKLCPDRPLFTCS